MKNYLWEEKRLNEGGRPYPSLIKAQVKLHLFQSRKAASQGGTRMPLGLGEPAGDRALWYSAEVGRKGCDGAVRGGRTFWKWALRKLSWLSVTLTTTTF